MPRLPVDALVERFLGLVTSRVGSTLDALRSAVTGTEGLLETGLLVVPTTAAVAAVALLVAWRHGLARALGVVVALHAAGALAVLPAAASTLATTILAVLVALILGCPLGVLLRNGPRPLAGAGRAVLGLAVLPGAVVLILPPLLFATPEPAWGVASWLAALPPAVAAGWTAGGQARVPTFLTALRAALPRVTAVAFGVSVLVELVAGGGLGGLLAQSLQQGLVGRAVEAGLGVGLVAFTLRSLADGGPRAAGPAVPALRHEALQAAAPQPRPDPAVAPQPRPHAAPPEDG